MRNARRPFSGPVLNPTDRHAPPGTPFKHGHGETSRAPSQGDAGEARQPGDVGFVRTDVAGRTDPDLPVRGHQVVQGAGYGQLRLDEHASKLQAQTAATRVHRRVKRPRRLL